MRAWQPTVCEARIMKILCLLIATLALAMTQEHVIASKQRASAAIKRVQHPNTFDCFASPRNGTIASRLVALTANPPSAPQSTEGESRLR